MTLALGLALVLAVAAAFPPAAGNGFVNWDDDDNFLNNAHFRGLGRDQLLWAWRTTWAGVYQPLGWMLWGAEYEAFGLDPRGYHASSVALHALNALALFALSAALVARADPSLASRSPRALRVGSALAALLFAAHPLRVEAVAWASCQSYLPCALFAMLSVLAYLRAYPDGRPRRPGWLAASWGLFALALLSKAVAMALPAVLLIVDAYPLRRFGGGVRAARGVWWEKAPFVALSLAFVAVALPARLASLASVIPDEHRTWAARAVQASYVPCDYPWKTAWPSGLSAYTPWPDPVSPFAWPFPACAAALVVATVLAWRFRRRRPGLACAWFSYLVVLAPNSGVVPTGVSFVADRYSYLAMLGPSAVLAGALARGAAGRWRGWAVAAAVAAAVGLGAASRLQCRTWRSSASLWENAASCAGRPDARLLTSLGGVRDASGRLDEAESLYREATRVGPGYAPARLALGDLLARLGRGPEAVERFREAVRLDPRLAPAHARLGRELARSGRLREARRSYDEAVRYDVESSEAHAGLGVVLSDLGNPSLALAHCEEAVRLDPADPGAHDALATVLARRGRLDRAAGEWSEAVRLAPGSAALRAKLGLVLSEAGAARDAADQFAAALRIDPASADAHAGLGELLAKQGKPSEAAGEFRRALAARPDHPLARRGLAGLGTPADH